LVQVGRSDETRRMGSEIVWATTTTSTFAAVGDSRSFAHGINYWHLLLATLGACAGLSFTFGLCCGRYWKAIATRKQTRTTDWPSPVKEGSAARRRQ
jgi:hypothetical protein